jgi:hypothetical protein
MSRQVNERDLRKFKDISPVRGSLMQQLLFPAVFVAAFLLGGLILQVIGLVGLVLTWPRSLIDRALVELRDSDVRIRTLTWATVPYEEILRVERRKRDLFPGPMRYLSTPAQKAVREAISNSPTAIYLNEPRWVWRMHPIPIPLRSRLVDVFLEADDEKAFINEVEERLAK